MAAVTLTRPLWWVARRSLRLLTGLILMALLLGLSAGTGEVAPATPSLAAASAAAATTPSTGDATTTDPRGVVAEPPTGTRPEAGAAETEVGEGTQVVAPVEVDGAVEPAPVAAERATLTSVEPDPRSIRRVPAAAHASSGSGHGLPTGQRAPPLR
ncbi:hypothetical protein ACIBF5_07350 [Micromonospora sp. NPDC050417]|uniref:hypothetical protein n=1 Tax=Micromonospora sp. NPDC050417 TaxID=3364280 RepID=UPI0037B21C50